MKKILKLSHSASAQITTTVEVIPITKEFIFNLVKAKTHVEFIPRWFDCEPVTEFFNQLYYAVFPDERPTEEQETEKGDDDDDSPTPTT